MGSPTVPINAKRREIVLRRPFGSPAHESADRGGRGVNNVDAILLDDRPEPAAVGKVRSAFVHQRCGAIGQRAVDDVRVPGHPANVRRAPVDVVLLHVKNVAVSGGDADQISGRGMHNAFGFAGGAAGVKDIEHVLGVHRLGVALVGRGAIASCHQRSRPACMVGIGRLADSLHHDHFFNRGRALQRLVGIHFQRHHVAAAPGAVRGHQHFGLSVVDALTQRLHGKSAEHHAVRSANLGAGQHRDGQLRRHAHVKRHAVALLHAQRLQHVGELVDLALEHPERQDARIAGLAFPDDRRLVAAPRGRVAVDAIVGDVQLRIDEPFGPGNVPVEHLGPFREPVQGCACSAQNDSTSRAACSKTAGSFALA